MLISIPPKYAVAQVVGFIKGKSAIHLARNFGGRQRNFTGCNFWARGYYVSTVGRDEEIIRSYIREQQVEDKRVEQLKMFNEVKAAFRRLPAQNNRFERFTIPSLRLCRRSLTCRS